MDSWVNVASQQDIKLNTGHIFYVQFYKQYKQQYDNRPKLSSFLSTLNKVFILEMTRCKHEA